MALSHQTKDHDEIRKWAETRGAVPAEVTSTHNDKEPGILRFEFPNAKNKNDQALREISWDEFFEKFDQSDLELVYQEKTADGQRSNFNKLIHPESEKESGSIRSDKSTSKSAEKSSSTSKSGSKSESSASRKKQTKSAVSQKSSRSSGA